MSTRQSTVTEDWGKLFEAAWIDLPAAAVRRVIAGEDQSATGEAGWKAYDAWVRLANDASNRLYENPGFGAAIGRAIQSSLQMARVADAMASAVFGNLWPAIGLPTATDVQALRADLKALREELRTVREQAAAEEEADESADHAFGAGDAANPPQAVIWNGYKPPRTSAAGKGGKKSVAL